MMISVDTNVIVRLLTGDDQSQFEMDFADALHLAQSKDAEAFVTFDKKRLKSASKNTTIQVREP
jgi:predicted nucleic acid-binding protein